MAGLDKDTRQIPLHQRKWCMPDLSEDWPDLPRIVKPPRIR
ncbi:hypothetical protein F856_gp13 [Enterobacteria phage vB_EcoS_Rogue1]|uniref:Uncharacterized protein n=1 Tax=Enterobacteria phage vB_EcoS_Rogue1 TaxID=1147155 RepID=K7PL60_9CAUD|nr:hypothetical protein F856_gp13 [Enterobacteria phage vB_EcoS_Rogue1]AFM76565.1 hypothetical protein Rogue1_0013 [Enterobacteria phage vB_EcoS_Rogue1]